MSKYEMYEKINNVVYFDGKTNKCEYYGRINHCGTCMYNSGHFLDADTTDQGRCTVYKRQERNTNTLVTYYDMLFGKRTSITLKTMAPATEGRDFEIDVKRQFYKYAKSIYPNMDIEELYNTITKRFKLVNFAEVFDFDYFVENIDLQTDGEELFQDFEYKGNIFTVGLPVPDDMVEDDDIDWEKVETDKEFLSDLYDTLKLWEGGSTFEKEENICRF